MESTTRRSDWRSALHALRNHIGDIEAVSIVMSLLLVGTVFAFGVIADEVAEGETQSFDQSILSALRDATDAGQLVGPSWLESVALNFTSLGGWAVGVFLILSVIGFLAIRRAWLELALVAGSTLGGLIVSIALKSAFARPRPDIVPHLAHVSDPSFPSGHAMLSAIIYLTLGAIIAEFLSKRSLKAYVMGVALTVTFLVGVTRVILGVHYPTDVLAGWCVGLGWALSCWLFVRYLQFRLAPDDFELEGAREESAMLHEES